MTPAPVPQGAPATADRAGLQYLPPERTPPASRQLRPSHPPAPLRVPAPPTEDGQPARAARALIFRAQTSASRGSTLGRSADTRRPSASATATSATCRP